MAGGLDHSCSIDGCEAPSFSRGWCRRHYKRWHTSGDPHKVCIRCQQDRQLLRSGLCDECATNGDTKLCGGCKEWKPLTDFTTHNRTNDGLNYACRTCTRAQRAEARLKRIDKEAEYAQSRWIENRDELILKKRAKRLENPQKTRDQARANYLKHKEKLKAAHREWSRRNKEATRLHANRRRAKVLGSMVVDFTSEQVDQRWAYYGNKCWLCREPATATDHVKPISKGGAHMLCNLRPICKPCNSRKHNKWPYP